MGYAESQQGHFARKGAAGVSVQAGVFENSILNSLKIMMSEVIRDINVSEVIRNIIICKMIRNILISEMIRGFRLKS
jgi:hypothetical protein